MQSASAARKLQLDGSDGECPAIVLQENGAQLDYIHALARLRRGSRIRIARHYNMTEVFADAFQIVGRQPVRENVLRRGGRVRIDAAASVHPFPSYPGAQRDDLYVTAAVYDV